MFGCILFSHDILHLPAEVSLEEWCLTMENMDMPDEAETIFLNEIDKSKSEVGPEDR